MKTLRKSLGLFITVAIISIPKALSSGILGIGTIILLCIGGCMVLSAIEAFLSYFSKKFYINKGNLIFIHGIINRENTIVPLDRIHSLRTKMGVFYRLLDMRGIIFDTLATKQEEIELILDEHDWQQLLSLIEKEENILRPSTPNDPPEYDPTSTVHYPTKNLLLAALCQNHLKGMAALGSFFGIVFGNLSDLDENTTNSIANHLEDFFDGIIASPPKIILFLAIIYIVILLLWIGRILLKYYDMTMSHSKKILTFTYGLITRATNRFLHDKICTIRIKRNILEKKFGFSTIMLKQAVNVSAEKGKDVLNLYGFDNSSFFLKWWLGDDFGKFPHLITAKSGRGVFFHSILLPSLIAIAAAIIMAHFQMYIWIIIPLIYLLFSFVSGIYKMRRSRISLYSSYFIIHNGSLAEIENFVKYSSIEVVRIRRTPFTRWFHRVSLVISTPGTTFLVRSIKEEEAKQIYELLLDSIR
ncbi:MAG: PH domain-containing protein [Muribaculaceae bacterium]|nr:PH domain-containing protein [Muribaculaceae bacterium]